MRLGIFQKSVFLGAIPPLKRERDKADFSDFTIRLSRLTRAGVGSDDGEKNAVYQTDELGFPNPINSLLYLA